MIASSNFGLVLSSLLMIAYTIKIEEAKGVLVKDLHFTMLVLHIVVCFIYSHCYLSISYAVFAGFVGAVSVSISGFSASIVEQKKLHNEIMRIENDDRKGLKSSSKLKYDLEQHAMTEEIHD
jgi:hypothetical protein